MDIPAELRADPPASAQAWVAGQFGPGARVTGVQRLRNAWAAAVHAVDVDDAHGDRHELVLRRWARLDLPPDAGVVENEAAALTLLAGAPNLCTPGFVAADPTGTAAGVPALVMTRLPGRDDLAPSDLDAHLDGLAAALRAVHAVPAPEGTLGRYRPSDRAGRRVPPPRTRHPDVWLRAFEIARRPMPPYARVLCHRDFHPGNVLWDAGRVSGVVDWTQTCVGPAAADVAHCRANLALLFGVEAADDFARRYGPVDDLAWFDIVDVVGWPTPDAWRWNDAGRTDITDATIAAAFDAFVLAAVERVS